MRSITQDIRYACRTLQKNPRFTAVIVLTLTLGIGANTAIFSVISAVLLRPLPFEAPEQLLAIEGRTEDPTYSAWTKGVSYPNFLDWHEDSDAFSDIAAYHGMQYRLTGDGLPERMDGGRVTAGFFSLLGVRPAHGRLFGPSDERAGAERTVVLTRELWQRRFGSDRAIVGQTLTLDQESYTVIGVLPAGFSFPLEMADAELVTVIRLDEPDLASRASRSLSAVGRIKPDVSRQQAQAQMDTIAARLERQYPEANQNYTVTLLELHDVVVGDTRPALLLLQGAVGLVLLIACANGANLFLARGSGRKQELAVRSALGAGRLRLVRQLLTESMLIGLISGVLGAMLAYACVDVLVAVLPAEIPLRESIDIDAGVLGIALLTSVLTGLVFGLPSAIRASRPALYSSFKEGGPGRGSHGRQRTQGVFVVAQTAMALMLLIGAGLLIRSFTLLTNVDPGFNPDDVLTFRFDMSEAEHPAQRTQMLDELLGRVGAMPEVQSVAACLALPLGRGSLAGACRIQGEPGRAPGVVMLSPITEDYLSTMQIPILAGRGLTEHDGPGGPGVALIDEGMARSFWPNEDPIGKRITLGYREADFTPEFYEIVGITGSVRNFGLDVDGLPQIYVPYRQHPHTLMNVTVRTTGRPEDLVAAIRREAASLLRQDAPFSFLTMDAYLAKSVKGRRCPMLLLAAFASLAVLLAAVGVYGVLSYAVAQRTHDIGVRMALGAQRTTILAATLKRGAILTGVGLILGNASALAATRVLANQLFGVGATDVGTFVGVSLLMAAVAAGACYLPARRATKVDPMVALRYE